MEEQKQKKNHFAGAVVVFLIFVVPAFSYFYLRQGFEYQKEAYALLDSLGVTPVYQFTDQNGLTVDTATLSGNVILFSVLPASETDANRTVEQLAKLHDQFENTERVYLLTVAPNRNGTSASDLADRYGMVAKKKWSLVSPEPARVEFVERQFPAQYQRGKLALIDRYGFVRKYYDPLKNEDMGMLIRHLTFVLPPEEDADEVELIRSNEI